MNLTDLRRAACEAGAIDIARVVESIRTAVFDGESIDACLASLRKWQPDLFHPPAARRESARTQSLRNYHERQDAQRKR